MTLRENGMRPNSMRMAARVLFISGLLSIFCNEWALAAERALFIDQSASADFPIQEAYFLVSVDQEQVIRVKATIVPPYLGTNRVLTEKNELNTTSHSKLGAKVLVSDESDSFSFTTLLVGTSTQYAFVPSQSWDLRHKEIFRGSIEALREQLLRQKEVLRSWEMQSKAQDDSLARLRSDADVIANLGRIVDLKEETDRATAEVRDLDKDIATLKKFLTLGKGSLAPSSVLAREGQLTRQLTELAEAAKSAEANEGVRRSGTEADFKHKLSIIEATRLEDYDLLQRDLVRLRKNRIELERRLSDGSKLGERLG